jgi:hypothetical protein
MLEAMELSDDLLVFLFELLDPNEELFCQYPHNFRLFPKLPLEIRLNIWRQTFHIVPTLSSTALTDVSEFDTRLRLPLALK